MIASIYVATLYILLVIWFFYILHKHYEWKSENDIFMQVFLVSVVPVLAAALFILLHYVGKNGFSEDRLKLKDK